MDQRSRTNGLSGRGSAQCIEDRRQKTADVLVSKFGCVETPMPRSAGSRQVCLWERRRCIFCFCGSVEKRRELAIETTIATQATLPQRPCDAFRRSHNGRLLSLPHRPRGGGRCCAGCRPQSAIAGSRWRQPCRQGTATAPAARPDRPTSGHCPPRHGAQIAANLRTGVRSCIDTW